MTIALGRAGRDSGLTLHSPDHWSVNGDEVDTGGGLIADTLAHLIVLRAQVNGLKDNRDEPIIGVNWTGDASIDGFYEVLDASVPMPNRGLAAQRLRWQAKLRRVAVYPRLESLIVGNTVRTNAHSIAKGSTVPWWAVPADATQHYVPGATSATRAAETGNVTVWYTTDGTVLYNTDRQWQCLASDYYDGAARVEIFDGVAWWALVGRRLPNTDATAGWRITNGLCRVSGGGGNGLIKVEHYLGGSWKASKTYKLTFGTGPTAIGAFRTISVSVNSAEVVTVQVGLDQDSTHPAAVSVDLTLRRGSLYVEGVMSRAADVVDFLSDQLGIYRNTAEAATVHTSGVHATSADSAPNGGGKYILTTSSAKTNDLTQGGFRLTSVADQLPFMIGYEPGSASGPDTFTNLVYAYMACQDETVGFSRR